MGSTRPSAPQRGSSSSQHRRGQHRRGQHRRGQHPPSSLQRRRWRPASRRRLPIAILCLATALTAQPDGATAQPDPGGSRDQHRVYIPAGSEYAYVAIDAPLPARQLGAIALAGLDTLRDPSTPVPSVLGSLPDSPATPPITSSDPGALPEHSAPVPGWPAAIRTLPVQTGAAPFGASALKPGSQPSSDKPSLKTRCNCQTSIGNTVDRRVAALYVSREFTVGEELASLRLLTLRARYRDGLIAHINGREVARRNLASDAEALAIARRPHGPEWETFYIPVVPGLLRRGSNVLSIETRPSGNRLAPFLDAELASSDQARIIRGPMVQRVSATSATVVFETDLPVTGVVEYGPIPARGQAARSAGGGLAERHVVELSDLEPGRPVHYRVLAGGDITEPMAFHTAQQPGAVVRFAVYGDVRGGHRVHGEIVQSLIAEAPDFVVVTGDLVMRGTDEGDWQRFFAVTGDLLGRVPYYPVAGNHDMGRSGDQRRRMNEIFELWPGPEKRPGWGHWYSFDVADVHFIMLDSNSYEHGEQLTWLEADLQAARKRGVRAIFVAVHDGPYSRGLHRGNTHAAEHYAPLLARHGATLTFSGHDHLYQRGLVDGFAYIVSGGGGAPLYSVRCGVPGKRRCKARDGMQHVASEHHYIMVTVFPRNVQVCPKRADGTPLEACIDYRLPRRSRRR